MLFLILLMGRVAFAQAPDGRYETTNGGMVLEFKSGKTYVTLPMDGTKDVD